MRVEPNIRQLSGVIDYECVNSFSNLLIEPDGVFLQGKDVISKHNDLVIASLMEANQKLTGTELVGIHSVEQDTFLGLNSHVFSVKLRGHWAPHLRDRHIQ